jgi:hypothetical protein
MSKDEQPERSITYLGTDEHSKKVLEGRFGSNVAPRKAHWPQERKDPWECPDCETLNKPHFANCPFCYARRP